MYSHTIRPLVALSFGTTCGELPRYVLCMWGERCSYCIRFLQFDFKPSQKTERLYWVLYHTLLGMIYKDSVILLKKNIAFFHVWHKFAFNRFLGLLFLYRKTVMKLRLSIRWLNPLIFFNPCGSHWGQQQEALYL